MAPTPNWPQLGYDVIHLAAMLVLLFGFIYGVGLIANRTLKDCNEFMKCGLKGEFTEIHGWFDIVVLVIFCVFVYSHAITELIFGAVGLTKESLDPRLSNDTIRLLATTACFCVSVIIVGVLSYPKRNKKGK